MAVSDNMRPPSVVYASALLLAPGITTLVVARPVGSLVTLRYASHAD